jgi:phosphoglycerol geranylgeranyltransferase
MKVYESLLEMKVSKGAGYWVLLDPDKMAIENIPSFVKKSEEAGVDGILVGGSLLLNCDFQAFVLEIKKYSNNIPVIIFPGNVHQITPEADALLFLSLLSGREAQHLIGNQVMAAPIIYRTGLEAISTAYMFIDSGKLTAAQFMSGTIPLPRDKPEIVIAHALAAEYLGFKFIYLEGGSGAQLSVPTEIIRQVTKLISIPVIVGGGIRTPEEAKEKVSAGASFVVTGNVLEKSSEPDLLYKLARAVHIKE